jgi:nucleoside-diphosphate-sugar epimerase
MISQWMDLYKERLELFKVKAERDFVHVNDVVKVIQFFMNNFKP